MSQTAWTWDVYFPYESRPVPTSTLGEVRRRVAEKVQRAETDLRLIFGGPQEGEAEDGPAYYDVIDRANGNTLAFIVGNPNP
jgi:hypothetical protein